MENISFLFDVSACKEISEKGVFAFLYKSPTPFCLHDPEKKQETIQLNSGESCSINVLFSPGNLLFPLGSLLFSPGNLLFSLGNLQRIHLEGFASANEFHLGKCTSVLGFEDDKK